MTYNINQSGVRPVSWNNCLKINCAGDKERVELIGSNLEIGRSLNTERVLKQQVRSLNASNRARHTVGKWKWKDGLLKQCCTCHEQLMCQYSLHMHIMLTNGTDVTLILSQRTQTYFSCESVHIKQFRRKQLQLSTRQHLVHHKWSLHFLSHWAKTVLTIIITIITAHRCFSQSMTIDTTQQGMLMKNNVLTFLFVILPHSKVLANPNPHYMLYQISTFLFFFCRFSTVPLKAWLYWMSMPYRSSHSKI